MDEDLTQNSIDKHSHHPSVKFINEHPEHQFNFQFKHVSHKEVEIILSTLKGIVHLNIIFSYMKVNKICNLDHPVY